MRENCNRENNNGAYCYFHPKEIFVGVCPICLHERLLILAAKQGLKSKKSPSIISNTSTSSSTKTSSQSYINAKSKPSISGRLPKILALGSFLHRQRRRRKSELHEFADELEATSSSLEDESYISIKFGENGMPSWEKNCCNNQVPKKQQLPHFTKSSSFSGQTLVKDKSDNNNNKSVVEHARPRGPSLRWRKRIGQLLQVIRWRRTTKANVGGKGGECCKGDGGGVLKVGRKHKGWITSLKMKAN